MAGLITVIRYINYGHVFSGQELDNEIVHDRFFCSFIELSNGRLVNILTICYLQSDNSFDDCDLQILPTACYTFGENFEEWWKKTFVYDEQERAQEDLTDEEYVTAKEFYWRNIFTDREISTGVVYCINK
jgi:hypothetical protein